MENIPLPSQVTINQDKNDKNQAEIVVEPCYPGYGLTLGNSLRRVLLSSLKGTAIYAVKIKGVAHEFSGIQYVKEDVVDIILNLKQVHLKSFTDEPVELELKVKGKKKVTAGDISKNAQVEIINKDLVIATLTDAKADFDMKIWVDRGLGYIPVEEKKDFNAEVGVIGVDAIYTPVLKCGFNVENVRVGDRTDYDKIIFDLETDGTITPENAFNKAAGILVRQFGFILDATQGEDVKEIKIKKENEDVEEAEEVEEKEAEKKTKKIAKEKATNKKTKK